MYQLLFLLFSFFAFNLHGTEKNSQASPHPSVCLNMIVKNEKDVIQRCLESAKPLIDYWVIVDTGSTDGTQQIIKDFMKTIPGELHERPWVNFEHNRNEALNLAKSKADYILIIDADEYFSYEPGFSFKNLDNDYYYIILRQVGVVDCMRPSLLSTRLPWKWKGVLHESLDCSISKNGGLLTGIINMCETNASSGRSKDPEKYLKDAAILEEALKKESDNSRYVFYLAQSYFAAKKNERALENYEKRASMPSTDVQETFFAIYNAGQIREEMGDHDGALKNFYKAYGFRPIRAEPLFRAAVLHRKMGNPEMGYILAKHALSIPCPNENCVEYPTYDYAILIEFANCALLTERWKEGFDASNKLLANPNLPADIKPHVIKNSALAAKNLSLTPSGLPNGR